MFTLGSWNESIDPAGVMENIAATSDPGHIATSGDELYVPRLNQVLAYGCAIDLTAAAQARFRSAKLLEKGIEEYVEPVASGITFGAIPEVTDVSKHPIQLDVNEGLLFQADSNPAAAAQHYAFALFGDGVQPQVEGEFHTVRFTASISQVVTGWTRGAITLPAGLKAGLYRCVGCRVLQANGVFFRLAFPGGGWRPGGVCANAQSDLDHPLFRRGGLGVWGEFDNRNLPALEMLGVTGTTQVGWMDVIRVGVTP